MTKLQHIRAILGFLNRTQIEGGEAETMVLCKQWLRTMEQLTMANERAKAGGQEPVPDDTPAD